MSDVRKKSPRAPTMALDDAVERTAKVYEREGRHTLPADIVAQALGYKNAVNGAAAQAIASLRYYGLLERPKEGMLAVTKDFETYLYSPDESQKRALLIGWLRTPSVFATLLDKYEGRLPSDAAIRFDLISIGFIPSGADTYVSAFRRSVDFAGFYDRKPDQWANSPEVASDASEDIGAARGAASEPPPVQVEAGTPQATASGYATPVAPPSAANPDVIRVPVRLPQGRCAWLELPIPFFAADKVRLKAYIDMQLADDEDGE